MKLWNLQSMTLLIEDVVDLGNQLGIEDLNAIEFDDKQS